jgi:hypothetical protein
VGREVELDVELRQLGLEVSDSSRDSSSALIIIGSPSSSTT